MIIKQIEKIYNNIIMLSNKKPTQIEMTKEAYEELVEDCLEMKVVNFTEVLDKEGNPINPFMRNENNNKQRSKSI